MPESSPDTQAAGVPLGMDSPRLRVAARRPNTGRPGSVSHLPVTSAALGQAPDVPHLSFPIWKAGITALLTSRSLLNPTWSREMCGAEAGTRPGPRKCHLFLAAVTASGPGCPAQRGVPHCGPSGRRFGAHGISFYRSPTRAASGTFPSSSRPLRRPLRAWLRCCRPPHPRGRPPPHLRQKETSHRNRVSVPAPPGPRAPQNPVPWLGGSAVEACTGRPASGGGWRPPGPRLGELGAPGPPRPGRDPQKMSQNKLSSWLPDTWAREGSGIGTVLQRGCCFHHWCEHSISQFPAALRPGSPPKRSLF